MGSEECKVLGAYGRDTLNDNGERLLSFSANHELAHLNTFFSTAKNAISHTFNGRGKKCIDYILTRERDRKLVRDVTVHPQPSFLPISDHNIVTAHVKLLGRFARNRPVREAKEPLTIDQRRLTTDPHMREEVGIVMETTSGRFRQAAAVLMMWRLPLRQPYCIQQNGFRRRERPGCRRGDGGETPGQKQRSAWRRPRDEQSESGRGLTPRTVS